VKKLIVLKLCLFLLFMTSLPSFAADVTLAWDQSPSQGVAGYKIYYKLGSSPTYNGTGLAEGASPIDAGADLSLALHGLQDGVVYTFTMTSYTQDGVESAYSEAILWTTNDPAPFIPALTSPADRAQSLPTSVVFSWTAPSDGRNVSYTLVYGTDPNLQNGTLALTFPTGKAPARPLESVPLTASLGLFGLIFGWRGRKQLKHLALLFTLCLMLAGCGGGSGQELSTSTAPPENPTQTTPGAANFTSLITDITGTSFEIYDFQPGTTYYWKVVADDGNTVTESGIRSFVTSVL